MTKLNPNKIVYGLKKSKFEANENMCFYSKKKIKKTCFVVVVDFLSKSGERTFTTTCASW